MTYNIAQLNIATAKHSLLSAEMSDFIANLDRINKLADGSPGFVWRMVLDFNSAASAHLFGYDKVVNMSVWENLETLHAYVYQSAHSEFIQRKKEWFEKSTNAYSVLWWLPKNSTPTLLEGNKKLLILQNNGPTKDAFTFKQSFPEPDTTCN